MNLNENTDRQHRQRVAVVVLLALALSGYHLAMVAKYAVARIDGDTYFLIDDDPMISMHYGRNLARGIGLVYNKGEHVEGFTNPLFTFFCAGLHLLPIGEPVLPGLIHLSSLLLSLGTMLMLTRFWGDGPAERFAGLVGALLYVVLPNHSYHAHSGFEVYMLIFLLVFALWRIEHCGLPGALLIGLLPLTHGMAMPMWAVLVVGILLVNHRPLQSRVLLAVVAVVPFVCYEVFRVAYYHDILPNTYWLKAGSGSLDGGMQYAKQWLRSLWPLLPLAGYAVFAVRGRRIALIVAVLAAGIASTVSLGGDIFWQFRFLFPASVLVVALAGRSIPLLLNRLASLPRAEAAYFGLVLAGLLLLGAVRNPLISYRLNAPDYAQNKHWNIRHIATGRAIRDNTPPDAVVGLFGLGYTGYYGDRLTVDMLGKADPHIARTKPKTTRLIGHNKVDFDYVLHQRAPDYLEVTFTPEELQDTDCLMENCQKNVWGYSYELALHPAFREQYSPSPVCDAQGRFVCFYSRTRDNASRWRIANEFFTSFPPGRKIYNVATTVSGR